MNKTARHTIQSQFALLLLAVFVSSLLIKPVHILAAHHERSKDICPTERVQTVSTNHYSDCPICDFEFCTFIPQNQQNLPQITVIVSSNQSLPTVACRASVSSHIFQLRAPPAL